MKKIDPPPTAVLEQLKEKSRAMLSELADDGLIREPSGPGPRTGDEIILLPPQTETSWARSYSYGIITGLGSTAEFGVHYVVALAQFPRYQAFPNCDLHLISESLVIKPEFKVGDELPLFQMQSTSQGSWATLVIEERKVALEDDGQPFYSYCFSIKGHDMRSKGLEEEALKKFLHAANPVNEEGKARKKELKRHLRVRKPSNVSDAARTKELEKVLKMLLSAANLNNDSMAASTEDHDVVYVSRTESDEPTSLGGSSEAAENEDDPLAQSSWRDTVVIL